jgi:hypothetical protein
LEEVDEVETYLQERRGGGKWRVGPSHGKNRREQKRTEQNRMGGDKGYVEMQVGTRRRQQEPNGTIQMEVTIVTALQAD